MPTTGISLVLDLYDCKSPALGNPALLEELFRSALQFAGLETIDYFSRPLPDKGLLQIFLMRQAHATMYFLPPNFISIDIYATGSLESLRPALELTRGFISQKLMARSAKAQLIERGG